MKEETNSLLFIHPPHYASGSTACTPLNLITTTVLT